MDYWKQITIEANAAFERQDYQSARKLYTCACDRAQKLLPFWFDSHEALIVLSISYQNLADLYVRLDDAKNVFHCYQVLISRLKQFNTDTTDHEFTIKNIVNRIRTDLLLAIKNLDLAFSETDLLIQDIGQLSTNSLEKIIEEHCQ